MNAKNIMDALNGIDETLFDVSEEHVKKGGTVLSKWMAAVAALAVVILAGGLFLPGLMHKGHTQEDESSRYREGVSVTAVSEGAIVWPWEWKTSIEQYSEMTLNGAVWSTRARTVNKDLLDEIMGEAEVLGYDIYAEKEYRKTAKVYSIKGVDREILAAAELDGHYVVYLRSEMEMPQNLGMLMDACALPETLPLSFFTVKTANQKESGEWYQTDASTGIWTILGECRTAPCKADDAVNMNLREGISLLASSEALGIRNKVLTVAKNGYLATNLLEYGYVFNIGTEAAEKIIRLAEESSQKTETPLLTGRIAGTLTEIADGYVLIDDAVLCRNKDDGIVYRVLTDDIRIRRCLEWLGGFKEGDLVVAEYEGSVDANGANTVSGAFSLQKGSLETDGAVTVAE